MKTSNNIIKYICIMALALGLTLVGALTAHANLTTNPGSRRIAIKAINVPQKSTVYEYSKAEQIPVPEKKAELKHAAYEQTAVASAKELELFPKENHVVYTIGEPTTYAEIRHNNIPKAEDKPEVLVGYVRIPPKDEKNDYTMEAFVYVQPPVRNENNEYTVVPNVRIIFEQQQGPVTYTEAGDGTTGVVVRDDRYFIEPNFSWADDSSPSYDMDSAEIKDAPTSDANNKMYPYDMRDFELADNQGNEIDVKTIPYEHPDGHIDVADLAESPYPYYDGTQVNPNNDKFDQWADNPITKVDPNTGDSLVVVPFPGRPDDLIVYHVDPSTGYVRPYDQNRDFEDAVLDLLPVPHRIPPRLQPAKGTPKPNPEEDDCDDCCDGCDDCCGCGSTSIVIVNENSNENNNNNTVSNTYTVTVGSGETEDGSTSSLTAYSVYDPAVAAADADEDGSGWTEGEDGAEADDDGNGCSLNPQSTGQSTGIVGIFVLFLLGLVCIRFPLLTRP